MKRLALSLVVLFLAGCSSLLTTEAPAPVYYEPQYDVSPVSCAASFRGVLRVWEFSAASPFGRPEMVVVKPDGEVLFSGTYQWVSSPGVLVAEQLTRDLSAGGLFPLVVTGDSPLSASLSLTGRVDRFAWEKDGEASRAVLKVETSLVESGAGRRILFHHIYEMKSPPFSGSDSAVFARAMGGLMGRFSERFRKDLCAVAGRGSS